MASAANIKAANDILAAAVASVTAAGDTVQAITVRSGNIDSVVTSLWTAEANLKAQWITAWEALWESAQGSAATALNLAAVPSWSAVATDDSRIMNAVKTLLRIVAMSTCRAG